MSDPQSANHYFCFRCNRDLSISEVDSSFLCNYCHEGFIQLVPGPVPTLQPPPNAAPRIRVHGVPAPPLFHPMNVIRTMHISQLPGQGQGVAGGNNAPQNPDPTQNRFPEGGSQSSDGSNTFPTDGTSQTAGQMPRAIRVSFRTGVHPFQFPPPRPPPPPPQPPEGQPQPNGAMGGLGAILTNLFRPLMQTQRNNGPEGTASSNEQPPSGNPQPADGNQQPPRGNTPNMDPLLHAFVQNIFNAAQQGSQNAQQRGEQNADRNQEGQPSGENQQGDGNTPVNVPQALNTVFQFIMDPTRQQTAQQRDGQNVDPNQEGQHLPGENQQPAGGNAPQNIGQIMHIVLQSMMNPTQQPQPGQANQQAGQNTNPNQEQQEPGREFNLLEDLLDILGDPPQPAGDNQQEQGDADERQRGRVNWLQLLQNWLARGAEIHIQFNGNEFTANNDPNIENILNQLFNGMGGRPVVGINEDDLRRLPMTKVSQNHVDNEAQCVTCMETLKLNEDVAELGCKHIFHKACLIPWLRTRRTCPVCRAQVDPTTWPSAPPEEETHFNSGFADMDELD